MSPSKYQPLADFLAAQPPEVVSVMLSVPEIEAIVGQELPLAAHRGGAWWSDPARPPAQAWLAAGWRVTQAHVRQAPSAVTFARVPPGATAPAGD